MVQPANHESKYGVFETGRMVCCVVSTSGEYHDL